ncbi:MAG: TetR/AcrR family transcriptional regulator [Actinobacteria bacterium]|nr:TetR/AcrR family transcriptional regulator [Actinomycetota bacterium]
MSIPYEQTGRTSQKARTRAAMLDATRQLLAEGVIPTIEQAANRAAISRTTAYRYFSNQRALLIATYPELDAQSLLGDDPPADPVARLELVTKLIGNQILDYEPELRTMLRLSLDPAAVEQGALPLRRGHAIKWLDDALQPLRGQMTDARLRKLVLAIRATLGIEALVWLTDIGGLSRQEAVELMRSSARTLLQAALDAPAEGSDPPKR